MARRRYTLEKRVQAVNEHLENEKRFTEIAQSCDLSSQLVRSWVKKYQTKGLAGLLLHVSRAGYYRWRYGRVSIRAAGNRRFAEIVKEIHTQSPDKG